MYEVIVGLEVTDDNLYNKYREGMKPILSNYGGGFRYDFKIAQTLKSESDGPINRLFAIYFESKDSMDQFFSNEDYLKVRSEFFEPSVSSTTMISGYER
jgi:uncharacterized protein (DUF1330 family)